MDESIKQAADAYEPPTIEDIPVRPDEMVLVNCKSTFLAGIASGFSNCNICVSHSPS